MYAGIEAGGTKMVCAVCDDKMQLYDRISIPTTTPEETIPKMIDFFKHYEKLGIKSLGIGCFGPIDLNKNSKTYGYITKTPKAAWADTDMITPFKEALGDIPVGFDTDVNGAILGEVKYGLAQNIDNAIYITIGTGIGVGVYLNGQLLHGLVHPEGGHILIGRHKKDVYEGKCRFHDNCFEGLASGPAVEERAGRKAIEIPDDDDIWDMESYYIAQGIVNFILCYSPQKIILWGGIMHKEKLLDMIREKTVELLGGYVKAKEILSDIENYIVAPGLGENPGIIGAVELGRQEFIKSQKM